MQTLCSRNMQQARLASRRLTGLPPVGRFRAHLKPIRPFTVLPALADNNQANAAAAANAAIVQQSQNASNLAPASAKPGSTKVNVHFEVPEYVTSWGQVLKVVGSLDELGDWKLEQAPAMEWHEGHSWTLDIQLPVGAVNFKVVMQEQTGNVRWEQGTDRSVLIPETTSVTGAPVGEVGVTCNFNDVTNTRVDVRPDRNYLKQQLKAVEARVMAIQEKKRKLDVRMSVLTEGLKKYDQTVALLEGGVQEAVEQRQREKEAAAQQQQQQQLQQAAESAAAAISNDGSNNGSDQRSPELATSTAAAAAASQSADRLAPENSSSSKGGIMVPILDPTDLPSFEDLSYDMSWSTLSTATVEDETSPAALGNAGGLTSESTSTADSMASSDDELAVVQQSAPAGAVSAIPDVSAIKASHVNETVLSATVDQLLAAAEDALARSTSSTSSMSRNSSASGMNADTTGVDDSQLAEEYVEELLAAASALEQQADQRATLLLQAAKQTGNDTIAQDIEDLSSVPIPALPSLDQLAESAAAEGAMAVEAATAAADMAADATSSMDSSSNSAEQVVTVEELTGDRPSSPELAPSRSSSPVPAAMQMSTDGTITFSAESLSMDVDVNELLAAVLSRINVPLSSMGKVTITATITPAAPAEQQPQEAAEQQQQQLTMVAAQQQQQHQPENPGVQEPELPQVDQEEVKQQHASPADAIAAVFSSTLGSSDEDDVLINNSSSARSSSRTTRWPNNGSSNSNGSSSSTGRYSKSDSNSRVSEGTRTAAAVVGGFSRPAAAPAGRSIACYPSDVDRQLAVKEAARKVAAEKVAAALAQVEEMRRSVVAANSLLAAQLHGGNSSSTQGYSTMSRKPDARMPAASAHTVPTAASSVQGGSGTYSKYRLSFKEGQAIATPAPGNAGPVAAAAAAAEDSAPAGPTGPSTASRSIPTVAAAAVVHGPGQQQERADRLSSSSSSNSVDGVVKEELLTLAALAAAVQSADVEQRDQEAHMSQDEF